VKPQGPPPIYQPDVVADCVLYAAEHPVRDLFGGGAARVMTTTQVLSPAVMDATFAKIGIPAQRTDEPKSVDAPNSLYEPETQDHRVEGDFSNKARRFSLYTWLETHPLVGNLALGGMLGAGTALLLARNKQKQSTARHT
jgi:hypothetical protein